MHAPITPAQLKKIHASRRSVPGLGEDDAWRDLLWGLFRVQSSADLSKRQAMRLIDHLEGRSEERCTPSQIIMLADILIQCGMEQETARNTWCRRFAGRAINRLAELTRAQAASAIAAARRMFRSYFGEEHDPAAPKRRREAGGRGLNVEGYVTDFQPVAAMPSEARPAEGGNENG